MSEEYVKAIEEYRILEKYRNGEKLSEQETKYIEKDKEEDWKYQQRIGNSDCGKIIVSEAGKTRELSPKQYLDEYNYNKNGLLEHLDGLMEYLHENNSFENCLPEDISNSIREDWVESSLSFDGGYPLLDGGDFTVDGIKYGVVVFGRSENEDPILGRHFIRYNNEEK